MNEQLERDTIIHIRRQWNDHRIASVTFENIGELRWSDISGGVHARAPQSFIHGYVSCDEIDGEIGHSCRHGRGPHSIKVCIVKKDNDAATWDKLLKIVGPKP